ncbi:helix-turn-helix domain-containing protein [Megasphaera elsdenii]|uniref:helix-turn-helix domain-containing protein n=1 Tax=Megasphaera elsdenii TaxID=907 RepID=UPI0024315D54|nr:helix-turn-helix transcriptional regulator [Megasphaera elsdenii]
MKVNELIANRRKELGLTLEEVADKVGVSKSTVKKWESGYIKNMRRDNMALLADALHISPLELLGPDEDPKAADDSHGYYVDPEVAALAEELRTDPDRRILFDATKDLSKDDIDIVLNLINGLKAKEGKK